MAAASVVQNWATEQPQSSSQLPTARIPHAYSYYSKADYNTNHYPFSHTGNIHIFDRSRDNRYGMARQLPRIDPRSASTIHMNHIYIQNHRPYASVISPGYLRQELQRSIHSRGHSHISSRSLHQVHRRSSGKHLLNKHLEVTSNTKNYEKSFSNPAPSVYSINSHVSNPVYQTENARSISCFSKIDNEKVLLKRHSSIKQDDSTSLINDNKNVSVHSFIEDIEPNSSNDASKIKNVNIKTLEHDKDLFISNTNNTQHDIAQGGQSLPSKFSIYSEKTKSLKSKILKVFSFSSLLSLENINTNNLHHTKNYTCSQSTLSDTVENNSIIADSDIYSFPKKSFSLDNVSISSTASSTSIMLRKISKGGKGMFKKSKRTLSNIFRGSFHFENSKTSTSKEYKKKMIENMNKTSVKIEDAPNFQDIIEPSENIKKDYDDNLLELDNDVLEQRKSIHIERSMPTSQLACNNTFTDTASINDFVKESKNNQPAHFKSDLPIKKGILKYTAWSSAMPKFNQSHSLTDLTIQFDPLAPLELVTFDDVSNASSTETSINKTTKSLSFSPKITIYDTWPSFEYDRRGEVATCNRLTPILAQRIKEELNTYKLDEMIVHEQSRRFTHFFN